MFTAITTSRAVKGQVSSLFRYSLSAVMMISLLGCGGSQSPNGEGNHSASTVVARDDSYNIDGSTGAATLTVLTNDSFGNAGAVSAVSSTTNGGTVSIGPNGQSVIYSAPSGYSGPDSFTYLVSDESSQSSIATVNLSVSNSPSLNVPPLALPDAYTILADSTNNSLDVLTNDIDPDGDSIFLVSANVDQSLPPDSSAQVNANSGNGRILYTPPTGFVGLQTLIYNISDGNGGVVSGLVAITVSPLPVGPVAIADVYTVTSNASANDFNVLGNDIDLSGSGLTLDSATLQASIPPSSGSTVSVNNGQLSYTPAGDFIGVDSVSYTISNGNGQTATGLASFTVTPLSVPPVALPDVVIVQPDSSNNMINALANDVDLSGTSLSIDSVSSVTTIPAGAVSTVTTDGNNISYSPAAGFIGVESLSYNISDGNGETATGMITITVVGLPTAPPPVAVVDISTASANSSNNVISVLSNDIDSAGGGLTVSNVSSLATVPLGATSTVSTDGSTVSYTPDSGFIGVETLSYTITDSNGATSTAAVTVVVAGVPSAPPPVAVPDVALVAADSSDNSITALANDVDTSSTGLTITAVSIGSTVPPGNAGTVSTDGSSINYSPAASFSGVETLNYSITDGNGSTATSIVSITVTPLPLPPVAVPDLATVVAESSNNSIDALANDADIGSAGLTISSVSSIGSFPPGSSGTASTDGSTISYSPETGFNGVETLSYEITDGNANTATGLITVTVSALAAPPVAVADLATVNQDSSNNSLSVLGNDIDLAGGGLSITSVISQSSIPVGSMGTVSTDGSTVTYSPAAGFAGVELLQYDITDNNGSSGSGLITVTVTPTPVVSAPVTVPDTATVNQDSSNNTISVIDNDIDPAGGGLSLTAVNLLGDVPSDGGHVVVLNGNQIDFSPSASYNGVVTLQYTVADVNGNSANGVALVTVSPLALPVAPLTVPDAAMVEQDSVNNMINVIANDIDPAAGGLTLTAASLISDLPATGGHTVSISGNQVSFSPAASYSGVVTLEYTVEDINGGSANGVAVVTVSPLALPGAPVAVPDSAIVSQDSSNNLITVISNDVDPAAGGLTLTAASVLSDLPVDGSHTVTLNGNQIDFSPTAAYAGVVTLQYTVEDTNGASSDSTVVVTVSPLPLEVPPVAIPDAGTMSNSAPASFNVIANDIDPAAGGLTLGNLSITQEVLPPITGSNSVAVLMNQLQLTPAMGYTGAVTVSYEVTDTNGNTSSSTIVITVIP